MLAGSGEDVDAQGSAVGRVAATVGRGRVAWLAGGAFAMGVGIWSMHFTGMLALKMDMPVTYDVLDTLLSMAVAIAAATLAFFVVSRGVVGVREIALAAPVMGVGIASMHYIGMTAMRMQAAINYDPLLVAASVVIAIGASMAALWLFLRLNRGDLTSGTKTLLKGAARWSWAPPSWVCTTRGSRRLPSRIPAKVQPHPTT
jgi:NO-binding membrane sensor protein with MHYT domain